MTIEEAKERIDILTQKHEIEDMYIAITQRKDYEALKVAKNSLEAWDKVKAEIASLKGDNFPNSYYIKIIDKHLQEVTTDADSN